MIENMSTNKTLTSKCAVHNTQSNILASRGYQCRVATERERVTTAKNKN